MGRDKGRDMLEGGGGNKKRSENQDATEVTQQVQARLKLANVQIQTLHVPVNKLYRRLQRKIDNEETCKGI